MIKGFTDLNIVHNPRDPQNTIAMVRQAIELGYDTVAINIDVGELSEQEEPPLKKRKRTQSLKDIPDPYLVPLDKIDTSVLTAQGRMFKQFSRVTMTASESGQLYAFLKGTHPQIAKYDIVAVRPANEAIFSSVATKMGVDLVTFDAREVCSWLKKVNVAQVAAKRGVSFEITYAPALADSSWRRQVLSNARDLYRATRGKNLVVTSGASKPIEMRGPVDVANLVTLFGWTPEEGRRAVTSGAHRVLLSSATRRTIRSSMHVRDVLEAPPALVEALMKVQEFRSEAESKN